MQSERIWMDISNEVTRTYYLPNGTALVIQRPMRVGIKRISCGGAYMDSHVVEDASGGGHYIAVFDAISWTGANSSDPDFGDRLNRMFGATDAQSGDANCDQRAVPNSGGEEREVSPTTVPGPAEALI